MAQISEILSIEQNRDSSDLQRSIHLFLDGKFYRAYEWSAWLCCSYINKFQVTHRQVKSVDTDILFIGFPITSLQKFTPIGSVMESIDEKHVVMLLPETLVKNIENIKVDFDNWRKTIPIAPPKGNDMSQSLSDHPVKLTDIMKKMLDYRVEQHTPIECMLFIADIQKQLIGLI